MPQMPLELPIAIAPALEWETPRDGKTRPMTSDPSRFKSVRQWLLPLASGVLLLGLGATGWWIAERATSSNTADGPSSGDETEAIALPEPALDALEAPANLLEAPDDSSQVVLPDGWEEEPELNPVAQIQAANRQQQMYLVVRAQPRAELADLTKEEFSEQSRQQLKDQLADVEESGPSEDITQVGEFDAVQYEIRGTNNEISVVYLHTTVETPQHFTQILTWTSPTDFARNEAAMQELIQNVEIR
ncbi:MAG: hypothetical protein AAFY26_14395 [Cyanobacteria bacterium J06638_22]